MLEQPASSGTVTATASPSAAMRERIDNRPIVVAEGRVPPAIHCLDYWRILRRMERHSVPALNRRLPQSTDLDLLTVGRPREVEVLVACVVADVAEHPEIGGAPNRVVIHRFGVQLIG